MTAMVDPDGRLRARPARVQNYLEGGSDHSPADLEVARALAADHPVLSILNQHNRRFAERAVRYLAAFYGISRFLDLGCGLPVQHEDGTREPMAHETARSVPGVEPRVVYVDDDPVVAWHVSPRLRGEAGVAVIQADLADPAGVLARCPVRALLDAGEPVAVIATTVLHYWDTGKARAIIGAYIDAMPSGSAVVISVAQLCPEAVAQRRALLPGIPFHNHATAGVEGFFGGLQLIGGRVMNVQRWPVAGCGDGREPRMLGGVAVK